MSVPRIPPRPTVVHGAFAEAAGASGASSAGAAAAADRPQDRTGTEHAGVRS